MCQLFRCFIARFISYKLQLLLASRIDAPTVYAPPNAIVFNATLPTNSRLNGDAYNYSEIHYETFSEHVSSLLTENY